MDTALAVVAIVGALSVGIVSPGPSFVLVVRTAIAGTRGEGLAAALGMGLGGLFYCVLALAGLHTVLTHLGWLYDGLRIAGGLYLAWLGFRLWQGARDPFVVDEGGGVARGDPMRAFRVALATMIGNPKTAIVYGSVFAALMPDAPERWFYVVLPTCSFVLETLWYGLVALAFNTRRPRRIYLGAKATIDRVAGTVLGTLGASLVWEAARRG